MRLTVEQDVLFPFIPNDKVEELRKEPIFQKYKIDPGNLERGLVSCTGAQVRTPAFPTPSLRGLATCSLGARHLHCRPVSCSGVYYSRHTQATEGCCILDTCDAAWIQAVCHPPGTCVLLCWI